MLSYPFGLVCSLRNGSVCACASTYGEAWIAEVQRFINAGVPADTVVGKTYAECLEILPKEYPKRKRKFKLDTAGCSPDDLINQHHSETAIEFLARQGVLRESETIQQPEYLYIYNEKVNNANNLLP